MRRTIVFIVRSKNVTSPHECKIGTITTSSLLSPDGKKLMTFDPE